MNEPTTMNDYAWGSGIRGQVADGTQVSIWMTAYAQGGPAAPIVAASAPAAIVDFSRFGLFPATNYVSCDPENRSSGDVFTVRTWPAVAGERLPASAGFTGYQKIILQTSDGNYLASDHSGTYHSVAHESLAAVLLLVIWGSSYAPRATLYPAFYDYGDRLHWDPLLSTITAIGSFSVQFIQPRLALPIPTFFGGTQSSISVPVDKGPIVFQQVQGAPDSSTLLMDGMQQVAEYAMPFTNGQRKVDGNYNSYLVMDGELRPIPNNAVAQNLFNDPSSLPAQPIRVPVSAYYPVGAPLSLDAQLVTVPGDPKVWLLDSGIRRWVSSPAVMVLFNFNWSKIRTTAAELLDTYLEGPPLDVTLDFMPWTDGARVLENSSGKTYLVIDGQLRWVPNPATYDNLFANWVIANQISLPSIFYRIGPPLTDGAYLAQQAGDPAVYLMVDGTKRHVKNPAAMARYAFDASKVRIVPAETLDIDQGADIDF